MVDDLVAVSIAELDPSTGTLVAQPLNFFSFGGLVSTRGLAVEIRNGSSLSSRDLEPLMQNPTNDHPIITQGTRAEHEMQAAKHQFSVYSKSDAFGDPPISY